MYWPNEGPPSIIDGTWTIPPINEGMIAAVHESAVGLSGHIAPPDDPAVANWA